MANKKISELTADTAPTGDDLLATVNAPGGTPASRKVTINAVLHYSETFANTDLDAIRDDFNQLIDQIEQENTHHTIS